MFKDFINVSKDTTIAVDAPNNLIVSLSLTKKDHQAMAVHLDRNEFFELLDMLDSAANKLGIQNDFTRSDSN